MELHDKGHFWDIDALKAEIPEFFVKSGKSPLKSRDGRVYYVAHTLENCACAEFHYS